MLFMIFNPPSTIKLVCLMFFKVIYMYLYTYIKHNAIYSNIRMLHRITRKTICCSSSSSGSGIRGMDCAKQYSMQYPYNSSLIDFPSLFVHLSFFLLLHSFRCFFFGTGHMHRIHWQNAHTLNFERNHLTF